MPILSRSLIASLTAAAPFTPALRVQMAGTRLFKLVGPRDEVTIDMAGAELQRLDPAGAKGPAE